MLLVDFTTEVAATRCPDLKPKMHHIRFHLGLRPRPRWGVYSAPLDPLAVMPYF